MTTQSPRKIVPITAAPAAVSTGAPAANTSLYEAHQKVYPRSVRGRFANWRWFFVWLTQAIYYGLPWLSWNDRQAVLFDLTARKFHIFGLVLWPQDFIYLTGLLVVSALSLFLFTAIAGRVWCGYACPQTVYTEIFLWFEKLVEGDRPARIKLDAAPWSARKFAIKSAKHALWIGFALWTGFTFVGYFTPIRELGYEVMSWTITGWELFWVLFYGFATYGNAGFMREQVCKHMCPYARFQGAMFDKDTLIITYDEARGERRGSRNRKVDHRQQGLGDCVDCSLCVQVCPTGIDIRDGLQIGCIGCAACIDACDTVMDKMGYARGLIRYSTSRAMADKAASIWRRMIRPRTVIYGGILTVLVAGLVSTLIWVRSPFKVDVIRDRGAMGRILPDGLVENTYRVQIMNTSETPQRYRLSASGWAALRVSSDTLIDVPAAANRSVAVSLQSPLEAAKRGSTPVVIHLEAENSGARVDVDSVFLVSP